MILKNIFFALLSSVVHIASAQTQIGQTLNAVNNHFGETVEMADSGTRLMAGSETGSVRVFDLIEGAWTQVGSSIDISTGSNANGVVFSISGDGNRVAVGSAYDDLSGTNRGRVSIFHLVNNIWTQLGQNIYGQGNYELMGKAMALTADGNRIVIGSPFNDNSTFTNNGNVHVFDWDGMAWVQKGTDLHGLTDGEFFGYAVSISADGVTIACGAPRNNDTFDSAGLARIYTLEENKWILAATVKGRSALEKSGGSLSLNAAGTRLAFGTDHDYFPGPSNNYKVRIYEITDGGWVQLGTTLTSNVLDDFFGLALSLSAEGNILAVGAPQNDMDGDNTGRVRVYQYHANDWMEVADLSGTGTSDNFGYAVSLNADGQTMAVGSPYSDEFHNDGGTVKVYALAEVLSIASVKHHNTINVFPNPSSNTVSINAEGFKDMKLIDGVGRIVLNHLKTQSIDISGLESGIYTLIIEMDGYNLSGKIIKK